MALAYALHHIESNGWARLTNYGEYLASHPPAHEVEIHENTSWSCSHGVERWRSDCGCHTGAEAGWNQAWRAPLREALDWLRDELAPRYEAEAGRWLADPWAARDDYISVVLDRSPRSLQAFLERFAKTGPPSGEERVRLLKLLEMQRQAMLMYTSCGWFFDDLAGIETVQILLYAGRAVQLAAQLFGDGIEEGFLSRLERARANPPEAENGRDLFEKHVRPAMVDLTEVAVHYAVTSLFQESSDPEPDPARVYCYSVQREDGRILQAGRARLAVGRARVTSDLTGDSGTLSYGVLHFGDHNLNAGVKPFESQEDYDRLASDLGGAFEHGDLAQVIRLLDRHFGDVPYSLRSLFRDEQRRILDMVLASTLDEVEDEFRDIYRQYAPLIRFLHGLDTPLPNAFRAAAELVLNVDLRRALAEPGEAAEAVRRLLAETANLGVTLDTKGLNYALERALEELVDRLGERPEDADLLRRVENAVDLASTPPFAVNLWRAQNRCYELFRGVYPVVREEAESGEEDAAEWVRRFRSLGGKLKLRLE